MHYRLNAASGEVVDEGDGQVTVNGKTVLVSPQLGEPLRIEPAQIAGVSEPAPFIVHIELSDGSSVDLSQLGPIRTQLLSQIGDVRVADSRSGLVTIGMGTAVRYHGAVNDVEADISLYEDGMVAIPSTGNPVQAPYAVIENASTDPSGYRISIDMGDAGTIVVQRLAQMTSQFLEQLRKKVSDARGRTGAFLSTLLPGLGPIAQRSVAGLLRDGVAAPRAPLDQIDNTIWTTLLKAAALPYRLDCAATIETLGDVAMGFHQRTSVEVDAQGTTHFAQAQDVQSAGPGRGAAAGMGGMGGLERGMEASMAMSAMGVPPMGAEGGPMFGGGPAAGGAGFGAPFGMFGGLLAMRMMRGDSSWAGGGQQAAQQMYQKPKTPDQPGSLTAAHDDVNALVASGDEPTILAFLIARTPNGHIIYETLNEENHATYVFADPSLTIRSFNLAMLLLRFHIEVLAGDITGAGAQYAEPIKRLPYLAQLAAAFHGRVYHLANPADWLAELQVALG